MKMFEYIFGIFSFTLLLSCGPDYQTSTFWISGFKTECAAGAGEKRCLLINKNTNPGKGSWEYFYSDIDGLEFKSGALQQIKVKVIPRENVPADASSLKYELIELVDEQEDPRVSLNDIWMVVNIDGKPVESDTNRPRLELNLTQMKIYGFDGCNNYNGPVQNLSLEDISFGNLVSTRKMCVDQMETADAFQKALSRSSHFVREGLTLSLQSSTGAELLEFRKVD